MGLVTFRGDSQNERTERYGIADSRGRAALMVWTEKKGEGQAKESLKTGNQLDGGILELSALREDLQAVIHSVILFDSVQTRSHAYSPS